MAIKKYNEDIKNPDIGPDLFSEDNYEKRDIEKVTKTFTTFLHNEVVFYGLCLLCGVILFLILLFVDKNNKPPVVLSILYILFYSIFSFIVYRIYKTYIDDIHDTKDDTRTKNGVIAFIFFYIILSICLYGLFPFIHRPKDPFPITIDNTSSVECPHIVSLLQHFSLIIQHILKYIFYGFYYFPIYVGMSNIFLNRTISFVNIFIEKFKNKSILFSSIKIDFYYILLGFLFIILTIFYRSRLFFIQGIPEHIVLSIYISLCILCIVIYFVLFIWSINAKQ